MKDSIEKQSNKNKNLKIYLFIIILGIILLIAAGYFLFFYIKTCNDDKCFYSSMQTCKKTVFIKEEDQFVWRFTILENYQRDSCKVNFKLLKIKKGDISAEKLESNEMVCFVSKAEYQLPEKDMSRCTGPLKEELQDILIRRMHDYLLRNVGEIKEEFKTV